MLKKFFSNSIVQLLLAVVIGILAGFVVDGTVLGVSAGTTIGYDADHYKNIIVRPMAYGQSLALIALVEALG
jgi:unsaturated rhamnogalacturonyl hydrolase